MNKPVQPQSSLSLKLPTANRSIETYRLAASRTFPAKLEGTLNRVAFSAAHVVADPLADVDPWLTRRSIGTGRLRSREHVWDLGLVWPKQWIPRSAAWGWIGRRHWN